MHGGNVWAHLANGFPEREVLDFSADLNPEGPPERCSLWLEESSRHIASYPDPECASFKEATSSYHGVPSNCVLPGNGTAELIHLISRAHKGKRAGIFVPTFTEYERAIRADGGKVVHLPFGERPPLSGLDLLFLCQPNNPTGSLWPKEELLRMLSAAKASGTLVVIDEAYVEFLERPEDFSLAREVLRFDNLIVLRSLTKAFAVPGLRIGYSLSDPKNVKALGEFQPPWSVNCLAAYVGERLFGERAYLEESRRKMISYRQSFLEELKEFSALRVWPSSANFFLCELVDPAWEANALALALARQGILIRVCDDFAGLEPGRFIRLCVRRPEENARLVYALKEIFVHAG